MKFTNRDYTVAWICALPLELRAAKSVLDEVHPSLPQVNSDHNNYTLGKISGHNVALACLPSGVYGKVSASAVVSQMLSTFPEIRFGLMVGIGGGVPSTGVDVRLGDVVISKPTGHESGVVQHDYGKIPRDGNFQQNGSLNKPRPILLTALSQMESDSISRRRQVRDIINAVQTEYEYGQEYIRPMDDGLFRATYDHTDETQDCSTCDQNQLVDRDPRETSMPDFHYGLIGSGDQVMKNAKIRDSIGKQWNLLCFEMEAAGFMDQLQPLVIRGICDYCDSHKNKKWQAYAALAAAAYAKVVLSEIPAPPIISIDVKLQEYYEMDNRLRIKRLSGDFLDMEQCYINLSIIEYQHKNHDIKLPAAQPSSGFSLLNRLKITADSPEREVTLPNLFHDRKLPDGRMIQPRRILIRGRAGVGKTTLCKKIVHDFYHQQMWAGLFDRVIWIPLRRLKGMSCLDEFFRRDYFSFQAERDSLVSKLWKTVFDPSHKRTLWLLDGLDEISAYRNISGTDMTEIFNHLLSQANVVITSRSYAVNISGLAPFDLELETVGFHPRQVQIYLAKTMKDPDITDQIHSFIRSHWLIQGLVRIPIQLDALCYSWNKNNFHSDASPQTMTEIYQAIELKLWQKDILNLENTRQLSETAVQNLRKRWQIQSEVETEMKFLECLAFTGLYSDIIEFHQDHRDWLYEQSQFYQMSDNVLDRLSFLRTSDTTSQDRSYHFIHLTFQEFFAAQHFVRCLISESSEPLLSLKLDRLRGKCTMKLSPEEFLQKNKFVTGLLYNIDEEQVSSFLQKIEKEPRDLLGPAHQRLLMHCFSELPQPEDSELAGNSNDFLRRLREKMELGCIQWFDYENKCLQEMRLCAEIEFPDHVLCELLEKNFLQRRRSHREKILRALAHRWHMSSKLMGITANFMDDSDSDVRWAAIDALRTQSPLPLRILQAVTCRLDDSNMYVRWLAISTLGKQSPWPLEILQAVMYRLDDSDTDVREAAIDALGTQSLWPLEILQAVMSQMDDSDPGVRRAAINALGTQSPLPLKILQAVICRLDDSDLGVRRAAVDALGIQSPLPLETLQAVTCRLDDSDPGVRRAAVDALGTQSPWPLEIIQAVTCRLDDSNRDVRWAAVGALGKHFPWPPKILQAVMGRLDDSDPCARQVAVEALGNQSLWPLEILQAVMGRLDDSNRDVRWTAINALGTLSPWPLETLQAVTCRLDDSDPGVRRAAVDALGVQSPLPLEIIQAVTCRLDDSNSDVRRAAVGALGTQSPWPLEIIQAVTCRLDDSDLGVRWQAVNALGTQSPLPLEILQAVMGRLDDSNGGVRQAAVHALGKHSPWPPEILQGAMGRLDDRDWQVASGLEALLWKHDDFLSPFLHLHADAVSALCRIWILRSIHETFVCYVCDENIYFEIPDGKRSFLLSKEKIQQLKHTLWVATLNSPILRLVYGDGIPFTALRN
ncbi:conserved hypothetical protein [Talaromyces stipitatus ATCC 10500]|uniref:NACHT domain-containing protein n=1 Tax=Talaromyces stipitatus (strain ATCC 10500 / CBS 375.48 / QM 6759 / NRRL 1006) TaxID=441959 RepID=B8LXU1_TALSN|nr:uncharacterized protein TSTA_062430 [Talaromyces stipitatus ATCC 10500]EED22756.1 conserved hypothetical protein [Talaromyces stipitatus ATCC 10500]